MLNTITLRYTNEQKQKDAKIINLSKVTHVSLRNSGSYFSISVFFDGKNTPTELFFDSDAERQRIFEKIHEAMS